MTRRRFTVRLGALHALVLVALVACGTHDPPAIGIDDREPGSELRLPRALSLLIEPAGPHYLLPTEGFGKTVALAGARVAVADYLDWEYAGLRFPHVDTFEIVDGVAVPTGKLPVEGYGELCFGEAIAIAGDVLAIGEPCANGGAGEVHVYARAGAAWVEEPPLAAAAAGARFGAAIDMAASRMTIGAANEPAVDPDGTVRAGVGAAYVYARKGGAWTLDARIVPADGAANDAFGTAVSMDAARIAASSPGRWLGDPNWNPIGPNGKSYLFDLLSDGSWVEAAGLVVGQGVPGEWTGGTLALCSGTLFVGSDLWSWPAIHTFEAGAEGWLEGVLADPVAAPNGHVDALACAGSTLVVGMPYLGPPEMTWIGEARIYKKAQGTWLPAGAIAGSAVGDRAGHAVAVDGGVVAVGIPSAYVNGRALGMVRVQRF